MMIAERSLPNDPTNRRVLAAFLVLWAVSCINMPYLEFLGMQHLPTVFAVVALVIAEQKQHVDRLGFALIVAFLLLHILGARYLYSYVPYDDWSQQIFGFRITDKFGFERNHYDRLVHFCFGLLLVYPLWQLFERPLGVQGWWQAVLAASVVLAASAVYEIAEWGTALVFAPDWADAYTGQQGDAWDAQKDMALAGLGAMIGIGLIGLKPIRSSEDR